MPTPDRTSLEAIVAAGRDILASDGLAALTMQAVAERVGVRAPSLYKRVRGRDDLVRLIIEASLRDLDARLDAVLASGGTDAGADLVELAGAMRSFARENPVEYRLIFADVPDAAQPDPGSLARSSAAVLSIATRLAGPDDALAAARTLTAWANGFIGMELAGAFRLGGDVDAAFDYGAGRLAAALASEPA